MTKARNLFLYIVIAGLCGFNKPGWASDDVESQEAYYAILEGGGRYVSNEDAIRFFNPSTLSGVAYVGVLGLGLGYQFSFPFGIELGGNIGPDREFDVSYSGPISTLTTKIWNTSDFYVMPCLRFFTHDDYLKSVDAYTIGLRVGPAFLQGTNTVNSSASLFSGSYSESATGTEFGFVLRGETRRFFGKRLDLGSELSYDYEIFSNIIESNPSGIYAAFPLKNPETNHDGSPATVDVSGINFKIIIGFWAMPFKAAVEPRSEKLPAWTEATTGPPTVPNDPTVLPDISSPAPNLPLAPPMDSTINRNIELAKQNYNIGLSLMSSKRYSEAADAFKQAIKFDPANSTAWQALGNANYFLGKKTEAIQAFEKAVEFAPDNLELKKYLARYKGQN